MARLAAAVVLGIALGCGGTAGPPPAPAPAAAAEPADPLAEEAIMADVEALCAPELAGRGSFQDGGRRAADYMARELAAAGLAITRQPIPGGAENVIGVLGDPKDGPGVIVAAHYDHLGVGESGEVYLGADDNASGAAILLALARAVAADPPGRPVLFLALGAEEKGLVGSGVYLENPVLAPADTIAVINFDMVGRNFFESGADTPRTAVAVGLETSERGAALAREGARRAGLRLIEAPARLLQLFRLENRTDDWSFRRADVAAIHFTTGLHADYHQVSDTPEKLVPDQMERIARTAAFVVRGLAR